MEDGHKCISFLKADQGKVNARITRDNVGSFTWVEQYNWILYSPEAGAMLDEYYKSGEFQQFLEDFCSRMEGCE